MDNIRGLQKLNIDIKDVNIMVNKIISCANKYGGYREYERVKQIIINLNLGSKQYEQAMRKLADRLGI